MLSYDCNFAEHVYLKYSFLFANSFTCPLTFLLFHEQNLQNLLYVLRMISQSHGNRASWELAPTRPLEHVAPARPEGRRALAAEGRAEGARQRPRAAASARVPVIHKQGTAWTRGFGSTTNPKNIFTTSQRETHDFLFFFK